MADQFTGDDVAPCEPLAGRVRCADGVTLLVDCYEPADRPDRVVLLSPATGVPAGFYRGFACWLAARGHATITWDWRGTGRNASGSVRDSSATMLDWATLDQPAVIDWALERYGQPLTGIGHSFGGQAFGLAGRPDAFDRLVLFASGHAWWGHWPAPGRYLFRAAIPVMLATIAVCGYLPGRALGLGANLPAGVARQWFGWCRRRAYLGRWEGHARMPAPVLSYGFADDTYAPLRSREALLGHYGGPRRLVTVRPQDHGVSRIGHLGFFRRRNAGQLWSAFLGELDA